MKSLKECAPLRTHVPSNCVDTSVLLSWLPNMFWFILGTDLIIASNQACLNFDVLLNIASWRDEPLKLFELSLSKKDYHVSKDEFKLTL